MVASGVCGNPEVVEDGVTGLLVDPEDPASLPDAIRRVIEYPEEAASWVRAAHGREDRFDRDRTFTRVEELLKNACR